MEPLPMTDSTPTLAFRLFAKLRQMLRPIPEPGTNSLTFTKRSKRRSLHLSAGMPMPVSLTQMLMRSFFFV